MLETTQAILALAVKKIDTPEKAITERKIGSFPQYSQWIQYAVREWYMRVIQNWEEPPKYYLSDYGKEFVIQVLQLLED